MSSQGLINVKALRELGYLQEVNRIFFHPIGMALAIEQLEDGSERLYGVWATDDPEGYVFDPLTEADCERGRAIHARRQALAEIRRTALGYETQPLEPTK